jgi:hypothetical protein
MEYAGFGIHVAALETNFQFADQVPTRKGKPFAGI